MGDQKKKFVPFPLKMPPQMKADIELAAEVSDRKMAKLIRDAVKKELVLLERQYPKLSGKLKSIANMQVSGT